MTARSPSRKRTLNHYRGLIAEYWVALILFVRFFHILKMRYKTKVGEIDLIARRGNTIHFIEVKYRASFGEGMEAVPPHAQKRIRRAAEHYILERYKKDRGQYAYQCDVVLVNRFFLIKTVRNAF